VLGVLLALLMVVPNIILIPIYGLNGAALATFIAVFLYNTAKLFFVYRAFKITPFTKNTFKVGGVLLVMVFSAYFWEFKFYPIINIMLKSLLIVGVFITLVFKLKLSEDINGAVLKLLKPFKKYLS
jgi:O-antigen/teichoic acid export membrane protein